MARFSAAFLAMCLFVSLALAGEEKVSEPSKCAVGYDEGLSAKYTFNQKWSATMSLGYLVAGADSVDKQPLNTFLVKVGGQYTIAEFTKLHVRAFVDFVETMNEGQLPFMTRTGPQKTFNQWNSSGRFGLAPEFFLTDHLSLTYKFGAIVNYVGTTYKLNANESDIEKKDNSSVNGGVLGFQSNLPFMLLHNIALYVYF